MSEYKATIECPKCNQKLRFPIRENRIKFNCNNCKKKFEAVNGKLVTEDKNEDTRQEKDSKKNSTFVSSLKRWKIISLILLLAIIVLSIFLFKQKENEQNKNQITSDLIKALKLYDATISNGANVKKHLTSDTKELFSTFIEGQYKHQDSASLVMLNSFMNSVQPLEYGDSRKFMYKNIKGDTLYFYADYHLIDGKYKLNLHMNEFMK